MIKGKVDENDIGQSGKFRWRGHEISRIEGLSDAVFAFAITLLVVSLEVPKTFEELSETMHGFGAFAICFALLFVVWHTQYKFFRRYGLQDVITVVLNGALLFVVLFYVYPLKFLFSFSVTSAFTNGMPPARMTAQEFSSLLIIYGLGFFAVYGAMTLLYLHAYRLREELELNELERFDTKYQIFRLLVLTSFGLIGAWLALLPGMRWSTLVYLLLFPILRTSRSVHRRRRMRYLASGS
jgi:uncharacterized membrane protein